MRRQTCPLAKPGVAKGKGKRTGGGSPGLHKRSAEGGGHRFGWHRPWAGLYPCPARGVEPLADFAIGIVTDRPGLQARSAKRLEPAPPACQEGLPNTAHSTGSNSQIAATPPDPLLLVGGETAMSIKAERKRPSSRPSIQKPTPINRGRKPERPGRSRPNCGVRSKRCRHTSLN